MLKLFEDLATGLATGLRHAFATEAGGLSPRLCVVRDLTLCSSVKSTYDIASPVNVAEVDARGGWTGKFSAPLESLEAARIVTQSASKGRAASAARALAASNSATDANALQTLLDAASTGVFVVAVAVTTSQSNAGLVVACSLANACAGGDSSAVAPVAVSSGSSGGATALSVAANLQPSALAAVRLSGTVALVISALANATASAPSAFTAFVNISGATVSSEVVTPTGAAPPATPTSAAPPVAVIVGSTLGFLGLLALLTLSKRVRAHLRTLAGRLLEWMRPLRNRRTQPAVGGVALRTQQPKSYSAQPL